MSFGRTGTISGASALLRCKKSSKAMLLVEADRILEFARVEGAVEELDHLLGAERDRADARAGEAARDERHALLELGAILLEGRLGRRARLPAVLLAEEAERAPRRD